MNSPIPAFQFKPLIGRVATTNADLKSGFHLLLRCAVRGEFRMRKETGKLARVIGSKIASPLAALEEISEPCGVGCLPAAV